MIKQDFKNIRGFNSLIEVKQKEDSIIFRFAKDYSEYKKHQPQSKVSREMWEDYWSNKWKAKCFIDIRNIVPKNIETNNIIILHANRE